MHSLELIDPKQTFFYDEIKDLYKLAEILERLDFNRNNYIINTFIYIAINFQETL